MKKHNEDLFQIGEVAKILGVTRKTILVYEDMGLLTPAVKDEESGYRYYSADNMTQIRCNAICPGSTPTEIENEIEKFHSDFAEHCFKGLNMDVPKCDPVDQANAMLYFASDEAKSTTGQVIVIDHGETL